MNLASSRRLLRRGPYPCRITVTESFAVLLNPWGVTQQVEAPLIYFITGTKRWSPFHLTVTRSGRPISCAVRAFGKAKLKFPCDEKYGTWKELSPQLHVSRRTMYSVYNPLAPTWSSRNALRWPMPTDISRRNTSIASPATAQGRHRLCNSRI